MNRDDQIKMGGNAIALFKGLDAWPQDIPTFDDFEATLLTGRATDLISSLRSLDTVGSKEFETRRRIARLRRMDGLVLR
jgi:hypothetical protein